MAPGQRLASPSPSSSATSSQSKRSDECDLRPIHRTGAVGHVERTIYTGAFLLGHPEFTAVWLAFKTLGRGRTDRSAFNLWLVGSGLSLSFGVAGGVLAATPPGGEWWVNGWPIVVSVGLSLLIAISYSRPQALQDWLQGRSGNAPTASAPEAESKD